MLARFFKIFLGVLVVHALVLGGVWVGFSAPIPRPPATFIYEGALPLEDTSSNAQDEWPNGQKLGSFAVDHLEPSNSNHWNKIRGASKTITNDHLGF